MRELFVAQLVKEVLGPRNGPVETLTDNPLGEYITGVLAPKFSNLINHEADAELPVEDQTDFAEDDDGDSDLVATSIAAPVLNPKERPKSLGLSFFVETVAANAAALDICITWARYSYDGHAWIREPRFVVLNGFAARSISVGVDAQGGLVRPEDGEIILHCAVRNRQNESLITLYVVNNVTVPEHETPGASHHVFQPQIRVNGGPGTRVVPGIANVGRQSRTEEEIELTFLYRNMPVLARGHLCAAVWREIDPERLDNSVLTFPAVRDDVPFRWVDGSGLTVQEQGVFSPPDIRTEFVPLYAAVSPDLLWDEDYRPMPELRADSLAEMWNPDELAANLRPLADAYRGWIQLKQNELQNKQQDEQQIGTRLLQKCSAIADRMDNGIDLLYRNDEARLAFCFAMRAMSLQATWPQGHGRTSLKWHPFQLAFVLMVIESAANPHSIDRSTCDLLWIATGAGKTEAYLALAAFVIAYRRRTSLTGQAAEATGAGVSVISRYTLRLLTIQQFRRTLRVITACELLRVQGLTSGRPIGWRPANCTKNDDFLWGSSRFSAGLWVGGSVTPNRQLKTWTPGGPLPGAIDILRGEEGEGEPAQIVNCPVCNNILSVPREKDRGLPEGTYEYLMVVSGNIANPINVGALAFGTITVLRASVAPLQGAYSVLQLQIASAQRITAEQIDEWWDHANVLLRAECAAARASRPGYFIRWYAGQARPKFYDFDIFCANPDCGLNQPWCEGMPAGRVYSTRPQVGGPTGNIPGIPGLPDGNRLCAVIDPFRAASPHVSARVPISAFTVDEQVYYRCPSIVIATVDKFARPAFETRASGIFGNINHHHCLWGYYRQGESHHPEDASNGHPNPIGGGRSRNFVPVDRLRPPDLIIQDELHLLEGPLGSLAGIYETMVDHLCDDGNGQRVKYVASTATVRQAEDQVRSIFVRRLLTFPAPSLTANDSFFVRGSDVHQLNSAGAGRLYMGVCAPGRGPLTPLVRIWARLLQTGFENSNQPNIDPFWTLAGYFNAIRELAGARALYRQDIPSRLRDISPFGPRALPEDFAQELSSRTPSTELPVILDLLGRRHPNTQDALFTTSMFGTGVDVPRLGLMVVNGQPKTTSSYIQATGRVGRSVGGLVVVFLRASRPRDLDHYEFFTGYHQQLQRFVEPITVMPFAPGAVERAVGPVGVSLLRNMLLTTVPWHELNTAARMGRHRSTAPEVLSLPQMLENRAQQQPGARAPQAGTVHTRTMIALDEWQQVARRNAQTLTYVEYQSPPSRPVVLGDAQHMYAGLDVVFHNAPQSLRDVEETCGFQT